MSGNTKSLRPIFAGQRPSFEVSGGGLAYQGHTPSTSGSRPSRNTHNLGWTEDVDGVPDRQGGCGPVAVGGSFEVVVAHLSAYDTGVGAEPAFGQQRVQKLGDGAVQCGGEVGGATQTGPDAAAGGVQGFGEADPVGVEVAAVGGVVDERP